MRTFSVSRYNGGDNQGTMPQEDKGSFKCGIHTGRSSKAGGRGSRGFLEQFHPEFCAGELPQKSAGMCLRTERSPPKFTFSRSNVQSQRNAFKGARSECTNFYLPHPKSKVLFHGQKPRLTPIPSQGDSAPTPHHNHHSSDEGLSCQRGGPEGHHAVAPEVRSCRETGRGPERHWTPRSCRSSHIPPPTPLPAYHGAEREELGGKVPPLPWQRAQADVKTLRRFA